MAQTKKTITIAVTHVNRPPEIGLIADQVVNEGELLELTITATDPDGDPITLTMENLPNGASFTDNGDGTGKFSWTPDFGDAGTYTPEITADDGVN